ncbi:MAG: tetratricopeptide repeat protein [Candidatus Sabulitectum sp.]|nr:tetratricopeptide repeat protein [Candidatus Sabulitectum sp.]
MSNRCPSLAVLAEELRNANAERLQELTSEIYQYARKAYRGNDNSLAENTCCEALNMLEHIPGMINERALLYRLLANIYNKTGDYRKSLENSHVSAELFLSINEIEKAVPVYSNCGVLLHYLGDDAGAYQTYLQALELAEKNGFEQEKARILLNIASLLEARKEYEEALEKIDQAEKIFKEDSNKRGLAYSRCEIAEINLAMGNTEESLINHRIAFDLRKEIGIERELLSSCSKFSSALIEAKQPEKAIQLCLEAMETAHQSHWPSALTEVLLRLAEAQLENGSPAETIITVCKAENIFEAFEGFLENRAQLKRVESKALRALGELEGAYTTLCEYLEMEEKRLIRRRDETISGLKIAMEVKASLREKEVIAKKNDELTKTNNQLTAAMAKVKTLSGMLPICASCKRIRDDDGYWQQIESYISSHSTAEFSHSLCSDCVEKLYPEAAKKLPSDLLK